MFIAQGFNIKDNRFGKYIVGSILVIIASTAGQFPWIIAMGVKSFIEKEEFPQDQNTMMTYLNSNLTLFFMLISFVFAMLGLYLIVKYFHKQKFIEVATSRKKMDWSRFFFSFGLWAVITTVVTIATYYASPENYEINFQPVQFAVLAIIAIALIPIQTSTEEYVFRGYLMQGFALLAKNKWFPLMMTSLIFGLLHIMNPEVEKMGYIILVYYIGTGLFLGIVALMDEGIELSLGFHAANNLVGALLVTSDWTVFQTHSILKDHSEPTAGFDVLLPVFVIFPILLFIFSKKYKWNNWKEKLTGVIVPPTKESFHEINELGKNDE
ncbi:CPBP family intramembrane metalloprotease [Flavobacterium sp. WW92]|uniref:CPBP family intramembrane glutamic endopeptidase n=1 Tax=unclassified Flavobacterium TaxID=196869 RepID=UPI0022248DD8|nr:MULTISPECIES: type II CAAX endopeptidase family protein [unclassified Flavobacterium]WDO12206.1 CPBP family intramembrane metalloprotease [Flavobacterium sp. WW92]